MYDGLDPSEKSAISYFLGMTMAKAFAELVLDVPWLMHLDVYRQELQPIILGRSRPDLVGQTTDEKWVALEAKGRTNSFSSQRLRRAKEQAQKLATVAGQEPALRIGMLTHFEGERLQFAVSDPPSGEYRDRIDLPLSRQRLLGSYYRPFRTWLLHEPRAHTVERAGTTYRAAPVQDVDLVVGLETSMVDEKVTAVARTGRDQAPAGSEKHYAGGDGVLV